MLPPVEVREAAPDDFERLGDICEAAYRAVPGYDVSNYYAAALRDVKWRAEPDVVLAAYGDDGSPLGCVTYVGDLNSPSAEVMLEGEAGIRMLGVDPAAWGRGVGIALTEACIELARAEGKRRIVLSSTPQMTTAHRMYTKLGFLRMPELDWAPIPEVPLLVFALDL